MEEQWMLIILTQALFCHNSILLSSLDVTVWEIEEQLGTGTGPLGRLSWHQDAAV